MKRLLFLVICILLVFSLISCSSKRTTDDTTQDETGITATDTTTNVETTQKYSSNIERIKIDDLGLIKETEEIYVGLVDYDYHTDSGYIELSISNKSASEFTFWVELDRCGSYILNGQESLVVAPGTTSYFIVNMPSDPSEVGVTEYDQYGFIMGASHENEGILDCYVDFATGGEAQVFDTQTWTATPFYSFDGLSVYLHHVEQKDGRYDLTFFAENQGEDEKSFTVDNLKVNDTPKRIWETNGGSIPSGCQSFFHLTGEIDDTIKKVQCDLSMLNLVDYSKVERKDIVIFEEE